MGEAAAPQRTPNLCAVVQSVVGRPGRLEYVQEVRLEMVCSKSALPLALETLQRFHPWRKGPFCLHGIHVVVGAPAGYTPDAHVVAKAREIAQDTGGSIELVTDPVEALAEPEDGQAAVVGGCAVAVHDAASSSRPVDAR